MTQVSQVPRCTLILGNVDEAAQHVLCLLRHYVSDYLFLSVDIPVYLQQTLLNSDLIVRPCVQEEHIGQHSSYTVTGHLRPLPSRSMSYRYFVGALTVSIQDFLGLPRFLFSFSGNHVSAC